MAGKSHWISTAKFSRYPKLSRDVSVDVVVVGGGIVGITAAYLLKQAGRTVALLERDRCCRVDTGHTTAHLTYVTDRRLTGLVDDLGRDQAQAVWNAGQAAIDQIETLVRELAINCGFVRVPGYLHSPWNDDAKAIAADELEADAALAADLGFNARFSKSVPFVERPGIVFARQAKFHPLRYLANLVDRVPGDGSYVFEHSEAEEFQKEPRRVQSNGHTVKCNYAVIATHVPLVGFADASSAAWFQSRLASYSTYAIGARAPKKAMPEGCYWDTADPYHYLRVDQQPRNDYIVFGGEDHKTGQDASPESCFDRLSELLKTIVPSSNPGARWTGQVVETGDGLPYIGENEERQFIATGFSGNGITFGTLAGMMAVDAVLGRTSPWKDVFAIDRKNSGVWNTIKENLEFPYYYVKDKLASAEAKSVDEVHPGEGKIVKVAGRKVAAYRDRDGSLTMLAPECTHMGCVVHWNGADGTWDCPCHGSRFQATGQVLAGPAETPMEPAQAVAGK